MQVNYVRQPDHIAEYLWDESYGLGTRYPGQVFVSDRRNLTTRLAFLHETAHVLQYAHLGMTRDYYCSHRCEMEAQAWAIALPWVKPSKHKQARKFALHCLADYTKVFGTRTAREYLNNAKVQKVED